MSDGPVLHQAAALTRVINAFDELAKACGASEPAEAMRRMSLPQLQKLNTDSKVFLGWLEQCVKIQSTATKGQARPRVPKA